MVTESAIRVGIYARISEDRDGQQTATSRQMQDARAHAERKGWEVADVFEDVDISAFNSRAKRPEFERLLESLRSGAIHGVVVWKLDRLTRQQRDLSRVMEACEPNKGFISSVMEPIDTRESYGQFVAELLVAQARMESANTAARQRRKAQEQREQGLPPTNGKRTFGYDQRYTTVIDEEAAIVRAVRDRVFAGESLRSISVDLERRGVRSTEGNLIRPQNLKKILVTPTIAGERELDGRRYPGSWTPLISPEDSRRLRVLLDKRPGQKRTVSPRKYLLTGLIRCGHCGGRMSAHALAGGKQRYVCRKEPGAPNCGSMSVLAEPLEEVVKEMLFTAVDDRALREAVMSRTDQDDGVVDAIRRDELRLEGLSRDYFADELISREEYFAARGELNTRLEANRARLAQRTRSNVLQPFEGSGEVLRAAWAAGSMEWRRSVAAALFERVEVLPGSPGRLPFDPARVRPVWKF